MKRVDPEQLVRDIWNLARGPYPDRPGAKERGGTSEKSASKIAPLAADFRGKFAKHFFDTHPLAWTADQCAERFQVSPFSARPRTWRVVLAISATFVAAGGAYLAIRFIIGLHL